MHEQLPPGPALDGRVCRALGWGPTLLWGVGNKAEHSWVMSGDTPEWLAEWLKEKQSEFPDYFAGMEVYSVERWDKVSIDGNVMLRAIEAMRERGLRFRVRQRFENPSEPYRVTFRGAQYTDSEAQALAHAVSLAILAALEPEASE